MLKKLVFLILIVMPFSVAAQKFGAARIFDKNLAAAVKNYDRIIVEKRTPIEFESGKKATNCNEYLQTKAVSKVSETIANQIYQSEYLICDALAVIDNSGLKTDKRQPKNNINYGREIFNRLNLKSFASSFSGNGEGEPYFFKNLSGKNHPVISVYKLTYSDPQWNYAVTVIAEGDFDGDGKIDLLLWLVDEALKEGNYRNYATLIISDFSKTGVLQAREI